MRCTFIAQLRYENQIYSEDVDQLIAKVKTVTRKNKTRQVKFSAIGSPPQSVPTRWGSWLNAALPKYFDGRKDQHNCFNFTQKICLKLKQLWIVL